MKREACDTLNEAHQEFFHYACSQIGNMVYNKNVKRMHIITFKRLKACWEVHPETEAPLRAWFNHAKHAVWRTPLDVKRDYASASIIANNRVVFNIKGNAYRLVVIIEYQMGKIFIRFVGTHQEYDAIDPAEV